METLITIQERRSIRKYTDAPVSPEQIKTLLAAAMAAPSAGNQQPWQFVVVTDKALLAEIPKFHPHASMAPKAPVGILVCGDTRLEKYAGYWVIDCAAAVQNLLLAAHDLGLGAVWTGVYPTMDRVEAFARLLHVPVGVVPHSFIPLGHPAETRQPEDRFRADRVHQNTF
jgi:nitroreductase